MKFNFIEFFSGDFEGLFSDFFSLDLFFEGFDLVVFEGDISFDIFFGGVEHDKFFYFINVMAIYILVYKGWELFKRCKTKMS